MNAKQLRELAYNKALEAQALLEADAPTEEDAAKADGLISEADALTARADRIEKATTFEKPVEDSKPSGIVVVEDETDKAIKHRAPFKSMGEFLQAVKRDPESKTMRALRSNESWTEGGFSLNLAVGDEIVGSMSAARDAKAISGMSESVPADGGLLVGTDRNNSIMARTYNVGDLIQRVDMVGISANSNGMTFFAEDETSRATGSRRGGIRFYWAAEADEKTSSKPKFRKMELKLNKAIGLVYATDELLEDARALEGWVMQNLPEELAFGVEDSLYRGTNAGMPLGALESPCRIEVGAVAGQGNGTIISENIIAMWARRWGAARDYIWMVNQDVTPQLHQLNLGVGTGGQLVYMPPGGLSGSPYGSLYGRPVIESEYCSTLGTVGDIALCAWSEYQAIDKGGVQSASSIHVRFVYDESVFRFVLRVDGEPKWDQPLTPFQGTNTQSPFVFLESDRA